MPENSWRESDSSKELDPISSLLSLTDDEDVISDFFQGMEGRRQKAALVLGAIWGSVAALHWLPWGGAIVWGLTLVLAIALLRVTFAKPQSPPDSMAVTDDAPYVSLLVAAKNEEAVIGKLVRTLGDLDYPSDRYELWVIDDRSTDRTPLLLDQLATQYPQLKVLHRGVNAVGGKSGALNQVLPLTQGDIIAVFDADAQVPKDLLRRVLPLFDSEVVGAVQVRKAIANTSLNFWTKGQSAEMALDTYFQQQRIATHGIGELRGNGQFTRRTALARCGGWNEQTITDDLDLTLRLHLDGWDIGLLPIPPVGEEGVTTALALWHQRNRWAEGGYQRYLDYWRFLVSNRMGTSKTLDLLLFLIFQYLIPASTVPDFLMALLRHHLPILAPLTTLSLGFSSMWMFIGLRRLPNPGSLSLTLIQTLRGMIYMLHWILVIASTTARISVRPKRLKWVKTVHQGSEDELVIRNS